MRRVYFPFHSKILMLIMLCCEEFSNFLENPRALFLQLWLSLSILTLTEFLMNSSILKDKQTLIWSDYFTITIFLQNSGSPNFSGTKHQTIIWRKNICKRDVFESALSLSKHLIYGNKSFILIVLVQRMSNKTDLKVNKVIFLFCENLVILEWYFCFYRCNIFSSILKALQWIIANKSF